MNPIWGSDFFCVLLWLILYIYLYFPYNINISGIIYLKITRIVPRGDDPFFLDNQHGRRDVTCKPAIQLLIKLVQSTWIDKIQINGIQSFRRHPKNHAKNISVYARLELLIS